MSGDFVYVTAVFFDRIALALILALALAAAWLAPVSTAAENVHRQRLLVVCLVVSALGALIELVMRSAALADVPPTEAWSFIPRVLTHSDYGFFWFVRAVAWISMAATAVWIWRKKWYAVPSVILLIAVATTAMLLSVTGHAGDDGLWTTPDLMNWLHIISTSIWGGSVMLYAMIVLPVRHNAADPRSTADVAEHLSTLATGALALVLISGIYNSWHQLGELSDLWGTKYGKILLVKLSFVAIMMIVGAMNRFLLVPQLAAFRSGMTDNWNNASSRFLSVLRFDSMVFMIVLATALVLGLQMPPAHGT